MSQWELRDTEERVHMFYRNFFDIELDDFIVCTFYLPWHVAPSTII